MHDVFNSGDFKHVDARSSNCDAHNIVCKMFNNILNKLQLFNTKVTICTKANMHGINLKKNLIYL